MKWNHEQKVILFDLVRERRHLSDIKHSLYPKITLKRSSYQLKAENGEHISSPAIYLR